MLRISSSRWLGILLSLGGFAAAGGCASNQPSCSSNVTTDTLRRLIDSRGGAAGFSFLSVLKGGSEATYVFENITTTERTPSKASCKATFHVIAKDKAGEPADLADIEFTYFTELTDDGRVYVTASRF